MAEFEVCRTLFDLLNRNIIVAAGRGAAREARGAAAEEAVASPVPGYAIAGLAVLLSLAGVAAQARSPFGVVLRPPLLKGSYELLLEGVSCSRLERLDRAILAYRLRSGSVPRTLEDLAAAGLVDRSFLRDPWARPYHYALTENGYLLSAVDDSGKRVGQPIERDFPPEKP
jgi:hypothetical protein